MASTLPDNVVKTFPDSKRSMLCLPVLKKQNLSTFLLFSFRRTVLVISIIMACASAEQPQEADRSRKEARRIKYTILISNVPDQPLIADDDFNWLLSTNTGAGHVQFSAKTQRISVQGIYLWDLDRGCSWNSFLAQQNKEDSQLSQTRGHLLSTHRLLVSGKTRGSFSQNQKENRRRAYSHGEIEEVLTPREFCERVL